MMPRQLPILYTGPNVVAILEDRKSQTRRVTNPQPPEDYPYPEERFPYDNEWRWGDRPRDDVKVRLWPNCGLCPKPRGPRSPYRVEDLLWVRETWGAILDYGSKYGTGATIKYAADGAQRFVDRREIPEDYNGYPLSVLRGGNAPGMFMPRWAARLWLRVTEIRAERVQDISAEDAISEGVWVDPPAGVNPKRPDRWDKWDEDEKQRYSEEQARGIYIAQLAHAESLVNAFRDLWNSINAKPKPARFRQGKPTIYISHPWDEADRDPREVIGGLPHRCYPNPWAFAISFERTEAPND